jgi:hypothetical protein
LNMLMEKKKKKKNRHRHEYISSQKLSSKGKFCAHTKKNNVLCVYMQNLD